MTDMKMKKVMPFVMAAVLSTGVSVAVNAQENPAVNQSSAAGVSDQEFISKAIADNKKEIKLAEMALNKSDDDQIKEIAREIIDDHKEIVADLSKLDNGMSRANAQDGQDMTNTDANAEANTSAESEVNTADESQNAMGQSQPGDTGTASNQLDMAGTKTSADMDQGADSASMDESMANKEDAMANQTGSTNPSQVQDTESQLASATGESFDSLWVSQMLIKHKIKLGKLHAVRKSTEDEKLKEIVQDAIVKTRMHRDKLSEVNNPQSVSKVK